MDKKVLDEWLERYKKLEEELEKHWKMQRRYEAVNCIAGARREETECALLDAKKDGMTDALRIFGYVLIEKDGELTVADKPCPATAPAVAGWLKTNTGNMSRTRIHSFVYLAYREHFLSGMDPLFSDTILARPGGPYCPVVDDVLKGSTANDGKDLPEEVADLCRSMLEHYGNWTDEELQAYVCNQYSYKQARKRYKKKEWDKPVMAPSAIRVDMAREKIERKAGHSLAAAG